MTFEWSRHNRNDVLDDWAALRAAGLTATQAAPRLGMSLAALLKALERARRAGDPRAVFNYRGVEAARKATT